MNSLYTFTPVSREKETSPGDLLQEPGIISNKGTSAPPAASTVPKLQTRVAEGQEAVVELCPTCSQPYRKGFAKLPFVKLLQDRERGLNPGPNDILQMI